MTVSHLTQQLDGMQQIHLPTETLINNIQNYNLYVLSHKWITGNYSVVRITYK